MAGYICLDTGRIKGLRKGLFGSIKVADSPEEIRDEGTKRWTLFHSHPKNPLIKRGESETKLGPLGPSGGDCVVAHLSGVPNYLINVDGIWEIKPRTLISLEAIEQIWTETSPHYSEIKTENDWMEFWEKVLNKLPTDVSLIYQWPTNSRLKIYWEKLIKLIK